MNGLVLFGASDVLQQTTFFCEQQPDAEECAQLASDAISSLLVGAGISALSLSNPLWYKAAVWLAETLSVGAADLYIAYAASVTGAAAYTLGASSLFAVPPATAAGLAVGAVAVVILVGGATGSGVDGDRRVQIAVGRRVQAALESCRRMPINTTNTGACDPVHCQLPCRCNH